MSKSAGNFYTLTQLQEAGFSPAELRFVLIAAHYRQPLNFVAKDADGNETFPALAGARQALQKIAKFARALAQKGEFAEPVGFEQAKKVKDLGSFTSAFEALLEDLNTPDALGRVFTAIKALDPEKLSPAEAKREFLGLMVVMEALGLALPKEEKSEGVDAPEEIQAKAEARWQAKQSKDWGEADRLRDEVAAAGWEIKDTKEGYEICLKN